MTEHGPAPQHEQARPPEPSQADRRFRPLRSALGLRRTRGQFYVGLLCAVLGFGLVVQVRQSQSTQLRTLRESDLVAILDDLSTRSTSLQQDVNDLDRQRTLLRNGNQNTEQARAAAKQQAANLGVLAGTLAATGPGIVLTLTDTGSDLQTGDFLDSIQELRDAGAEAMQLNDQRVVASTAITRDSTGFLVNAKPVASPYTLRAIGDPQVMNTALRIPGGVLATLASNGVHTGLRTSPNVEVTAVLPEPKSQYAAPETSPTASPTP